jgi:Protein of unknown function (DUF2652)/Activator of Hsp90 ATPase homolog 1-like protein
MPSSTRTGFLVVADITGYSAYLNDSELEHAQDVLKELLDLLIDNAKAPLVLAGLEGDAVLSYTIDSERFQGQAFVEMIEHTYVSFKRAIDLMVMNTSCQCNACANINNLDLKFFVHHGEFVLSNLRGREEMVGSDVNLIHRVMKNHIAEETGYRAYTLYTDAAVDKLGLEGFGEELTKYSEEFDNAGVVAGLVMDMKPIWETGRDASRLDIGDTVFASWEEEYPVSAEIMWGYLTNPETRAVFSGATKQIAHDRRAGRIGEGTTYECFHGNGAPSHNIILEWHAFTRIVFKNPMTKRSSFIATMNLESTDTGTRVTLIYGKLDGPKPELLILRAFWNLWIKRRAGVGLPLLRQLIEVDIAAGRVVAPDSASFSTDEIEAAARQALASP